MGPKTGLLSNKGYRVDCFKSPTEGLICLAEAVTVPYFLIIAGYAEIQTGQKTVLAKAREISPETQRLLVAAPSELPSFVNAINSAGIHACLPLPFSDEDLVVQVRLRHDEYETGRKRKNLQKTIQRQNKQLFQIAGNLKKKEAVYGTQIQQKDKEIKILAERLKSILGDGGADGEADLKQLLENEKVRFDSFAFKQAFDDLKIRAGEIFSTILSERGVFDALSPETLPPNAAVDTSPYKSLAGLLTTELIRYFTWKSSPESASGSAAEKSEADRYFTMDFTDNQTRAYIRCRPDAPETVSLYQVKQCLRQNAIVTGIKDDAEIEAWLDEPPESRDAFLVAQGTPPVYPVNGKIHYYFPTSFRKAGKLNPDGSIDFRDRGDVPHVEKEVLLAAKSMPEPGTSGMDVKGREITVPEPVDPAFSPGTGTRLSEDSTRIFSIIEGEPHLDVMGVVSVNQELRLKGDVGFETGNIDFKGNVIVPGTVKEGFRVKCVSLTAKQISGARIDVSGDLNVSMGIVDTQLINVKGNIQAKYIRNSTINGFGDLTVQKEIIDSAIYLSGACSNERGAIFNSTVSAKLGIKAGTVGNEAAGSSVLTVGVDEHLIRITDHIKSKLAFNRAAIKETESEISQMKEVDKWLHGTITGNAHIQDRTQLEIRDLEKKRASLESRKDAAELKKISDMIIRLEKKARTAEEKINQGFEHQDQIHNDISVKTAQIQTLEKLTLQLTEELENLEQIANKSDPVPELSVTRHIQSLTKIKASHSYKILDKSFRTCTIRETCREEDGTSFYVIEVV